VKCDELWRESQAIRALPLKERAKTRIGFAERSFLKPMRMNREKSSGSTGEMDRMSLVSYIPTDVL
jgi:hypothetical protein